MRILTGDWSTQGSRWFQRHFDSLMLTNLKQMFIREEKTYAKLFLQLFMEFYVILFLSCFTQFRMHSWPFFDRFTASH